MIGDVDQVPRPFSFDKIWLPYLGGLGARNFIFSFISSGYLEIFLVWVLSIIHVLQKSKLSVLLLCRQIMIHAQLSKSCQVMQKYMLFRCCLSACKLCEPCSNRKCQQLRSYLVPLPITLEVLASLTIQLRQAHILPSGWNQVSMETKSPLLAGFASVSKPKSLGRTF